MSKKGVEHTGIGSPVLVLNVCIWDKWIAEYKIAEKSLWPADFESLCILWRPNDNRNSFFLRWKRRDPRKDHHHRGSHTGTLLKPHPEKLPAPPNSNTVERVYAPPGLPHRVTSPPKNKNGGYAHIWELRQGMNGYDGDETYTTQENGRRVNLSDPGCYYSQEDESHKGGGYSHEREHVYESPKPSRRDDELSLTEGPYYHEFDAHDMEHGRPSFDMAYPDEYDHRVPHEGRMSLADD